MITYQQENIQGGDPVKIVTDSAADLPAQEASALGITVAPLYIKFPEGEVNSEQLTPDEFYTRLRKMEPEIPTTSQPSSGAFAQIYRELFGQGHDEILSVHISTGLSGTLESARSGAEHEPGAQITLVDTMTLSGAERFQVLAAALAAKAGWDKNAILERLNEIRAQSEIIYTLDTLKYLARGGRIGRVQALAGSLLNIKPVILVDKKDGKYSTAGRGRTLNKAFEVILEYLVQVYGDKTPLWASIMHGQFRDQADHLAEIVCSRLQVEKLEVLRISPVLGVHTGPGVVGVAAVPYYLMEDFVQGLP